MRRLILILVAAVAFTSVSAAQAQTTDPLLDALDTRIDARLDPLRQRVTDLEAQVEALEGSDVGARLDALEGAFGPIPDQLAALDVRVTDIEDWIASGAEPEPTPTPEPTATPTPEPTATPTPTPTPPPVRTDRCFSDPGACGFPDPDYGTVGVPAGTNLTPSGGFTVTTPGAVIDGLDVTGVIRVAADNVTIKNTRFNAPGVGNTGSWMLVIDCDCDTLVQNVEFTTSGSNRSEFAARNDVDGTLTLDRVYHHGNIDAMAYCGSRTNNGGGCIVKDTYSIIERVNIPEDHLENVYLDNSNVTVQHSVLLLAQPQTSVVFGNVDNGFGGPCSNRLTITDNLLAGGGQMLTACGHMTSDGTSDVRITDNRFARCGNGNEVQGGGGTWLCSGLSIGQHDGEGYYPRGGSFMVCTGIPSNAVITGNVWDKDDTPADDRC